MSSSWLHVTNSSNCKCCIHSFPLNLIKENPFGVNFNGIQQISKKQKVIDKKLKQLTIESSLPASSIPREFISCNKSFLVSRLFKILAQPSSSIVSLWENHEKMRSIQLFKSKIIKQSFKLKTKESFESWFKYYLAMIRAALLAVQMSSLPSKTVILDNVSSSISFRNIHDLPSIVSA